MNRTRQSVLVTTGLAVLLLSACSTDADVASKNVSQAADNFQVLRRIVFFNGITDKYLLEVDGYCSVDTSNPKNLSVTCKISPTAYKKSYLGLSDNVSWFLEQIDAGSDVSPYHYAVTFKPETIIPDVTVR